MPGASSPILDTWAPAQYVYGSSGGSGPMRSTDDNTGTAAVNTTATDQTYDATITYKIAGTIILALVVIFVLQGSGFRFVGSAQVGVGR